MQDFKAVMGKHVLHSRWKLRVGCKWFLRSVLSCCMLTVGPHSGGLLAKFPAGLETERAVNNIPIYFNASHHVPSPWEFPWLLNIASLDMSGWGPKGSQLRFPRKLLKAVGKVKDNMLPCASVSKQKAPLVPSYCCMHEPHYMMSAQQHSIQRYHQQHAHRVHRLFDWPSWKGIVFDEGNYAFDAASVSFWSEIRILMLFNDVSLRAAPKIGS